MAIDAEYLVTLERHRLRTRLFQLLGELEICIKAHNTRRTQELLHEIRRLFR